MLWYLSPLALVSGADGIDMFYNWMAPPRERRIFGIQCPITGKLGCFVTTPMGFAPVPGVNDENVKEILRVTMDAVEGDIEK